MRTRVQQAVGLRAALLAARAHDRRAGTVFRMAQAGEVDVRATVAAYKATEPAAQAEVPFSLLRLSDHSREQPLGSALPLLLALLVLEVRP